MRAKAPLQDSTFVTRMDSPYASPYDRLLLESVRKHGGFVNAHTHVDRGDTMPDDYLGHINTTPLEVSMSTLAVKQDATGNLHDGIAYSADDLRSRMIRVIERQIVYGTTSLATCIDVTPDIGESGMLAFRIAQEIKKEYTDRITILLGPNPIFGFKEESGRWEIYQEAAKQADFLSVLPEKDYFADPVKRDGKVGYNRHLRMGVKLACELGKEIHLHLDQANNPQEKGTLTLIEGLGWLDQPVIKGQTTPTVWIIHCISPSAYPEDEFARVIEGLLKYNIGVIVCPSAAISMLQLRPIMAPSHNSIARVLELAKAGVPLQIGTDNICDMYMPSSEGDMLSETKRLADAVRFYAPHVLAKLAAAVRLNAVDRATIGNALYELRKKYQSIDSEWQSAIE